MSQLKDVYELLFRPKAFLRRDVAKELSKNNFEIFPAEKRKDFYSKKEEEIKQGRKNEIKQSRKDLCITILCSIGLLIIPLFVRWLLHGQLKAISATTIFELFTLVIPGVASFKKSKDSKTFDGDTLLEKTNNFLFYLIVGICIIFNIFLKTIKL
ncbi:hypothetical protein WKK05_41755 (plasmid) [Nostoc sp. UHCC 0302]|uniref:hypothetical protein n=1 Tax=Nostoc sp. UHCC 0302 TaxID=3134896 RepID=UPI00311CA0B1